jgi:hypothetical protein
MTEPIPTPPPWRALLSYNGHDHHITSPDNVIIAKIYARPHNDPDPEPPHGSVSEAEGRANALAIVRAVNTQEQMLRALLIALSYLLPDRPHVTDAPPHTQAEIVDILAAAIRAATEAAE